MGREQKKSGQVAALALCAGLGLAGCSAGHGEYTQAHKDQANLRVAQMKSATEWDMAQQQFLAGDLKKALASVDRSIGLNTEVAKSHVLKGRILIEMGGLEPALASLDKAIELDAENTDAHYYRGIVFERFGQLDQALACYQRAAETDVTNPQYPLAAAEMLIELKRLDEAQDLLVGGAKRFDHNAGIRQTLGHIAMMRHDYTRAVDVFSEACRLAAEDPGLQEDLARAQIAAGMFAEAETTLNWVVSQDKQNRRRDLVQLQARCLIELDRPVEARNLLLRLTSDDRGTNDLDLWRDLGTVSVMLSDRIQLKRCAQRLMSIAPHSSDGYVLMAMWHRQMGDLNSALAAVRRARDLPGSNAPALEGILCHQLGRESEAKQAFALAAKRDQDSAKAGAAPAGMRQRPNAIVEVGDND